MATSADGRAGAPADNRRFRNWNIRNIIGNLVQAEEHARLVDDGMDPEHTACIQKHLAATRGGAGELVGHAQAPPEREMAQALFRDLDEQLERAQTAGEIPDLDAIKRFRKQVEPHTVFDARNCQVCGAVEELLRRSGSNDPNMSTDSSDEEAGAMTIQLRTPDQDDAGAAGGQVAVTPRDTDAGGDGGDVEDGDGDGDVDLLPELWDGSGEPAVVGQSTGPVAGVMGPLLDTLTMGNLGRRDRVGKYMGTPLVGQGAIGLLDMFTTELGKRVGAGGLSGVMLASVATGVVDDAGTVNEFLMLSGLGLGEALVGFTPGEVAELERNVENAMAGDLDVALVDDRAGGLGRDLERTADEMLAGVDPARTHPDEQRRREDAMATPPAPGAQAGAGAGGVGGGVADVEPEMEKPPVGF